MTAEQAIDILNGIRADNLNLNDAYTKDKYDALDMAIQALKAQDKADTAYDRGYDRGYDDGMCDYEVCHKCKHFEYDELFIDETGEERDTSYCGRQAQADGEYINKKDAIEFFKDDVYVANELNNMPTVAIPSATGHWIGIDEEPHEDYECDVCGYVVSTWTANIKPQEEYKFCPNCGARMESEE